MDKKIKVVIIGDKKVGKTKLFNLLINNNLVEYYIHTKDCKTQVYDDFCFWDITSNVNFTNTRIKYCVNADIIIIVLDQNKDPLENKAIYQKYKDESTNNNAIYIAIDQYNQYDNYFSFNDPNLCNNLKQFILDNIKPINSGQSRYPNLINSLYLFKKENYNYLCNHKNSTTFGKECK